MDRRDWLHTIATAGLGGLAGCLSGVSDVIGDPTEKRVFEYGESASHGGIRVTTTRVVTFRVVSYRAGPNDERRFWQPREGKRIAIASYRAETDKVDDTVWPAREDFHLVTDAGDLKPRMHTPDGGTVYTIRTPAGREVRRPTDREFEDLVRREWDAVYVTESTVPQATTKWVGPPDPVFWMPGGR